MQNLAEIQTSEGKIKALLPNIDLTNYTLSLLVIMYLLDTNDNKDKICLSSLWQQRIKEKWNKSLLHSSQAGYWGHKKETQFRFCTPIVKLDRATVLTFPSLNSCPSHEIPHLISVHRLHSSINCKTHYCDLLKCNANTGPSYPHNQL